MSPIEDDDLHDYVLGNLPEAEHRALTARIARSPELQRQLLSLRETWGLVGDALSAVRPEAQARARLLRALDTGDRFSPFLQDLARHFDLGTERVKELFSQIDLASSWESGPMPGISVMHFRGGPNTVAPDTGFVRLPRGLRFPKHRHLGPEVNYVLQGAVQNGDGELFLPGEAIIMACGTSHEFSIPDSADALIAVVQGGFELL